MKHLTLALAGSLLPAVALAQAPTLAPTTVTASRSSETVDAALVPVTVIDRPAIERSQARDLLDLLRLQAGIDLARTGGPGGATSLFLRGTNSNHVLVLVDGVRVSSFNTGALDFSNLPLVQVERIEIVRGPRAAFWGSDAIGGVIQVFTRRPQGGSAALSYGSWNTRRLEAALGSSGAVRVSAAVADERSDGFSAQNENGFGYFPDDDGQRQRSASLALGVDLGRQALEARVFRADTDAQFDAGAAEASFGPAESEARTQTLSVSVAGPLAERWSHQLVAAEGRNDLVTPINGSAFDTRRRSLDWQNAWQLQPGQQLLFGLNWLDEEGAAFSGFGEPYAGDRRNRAAWLGWRGRIGALDAEAVGRHDDNSDFGGETTFSGGLGWRVADGLRLSASFGEGFRAPNLNELYSPGFGGLFAGNPALEPERSRSLELGADVALGGAGELRLRAFRTDLRDLISFTGGGVSQAENIARARIEGVEAEYGWRGERWQVEATATVQDPENRETGQPLLRRARQKAALSVDRALGDRWRIGGELVALGPRKDAGFPEAIDLPGHVLASLRAAWQVHPDWQLELRGDNLGDVDHELVRGFNTPGRSVFATVRWRPGG